MHLSCREGMGHLTITEWNWTMPTMSTMSAVRSRITGRSNMLHCTRPKWHFIRKFVSYCHNKNVHIILLRCVKEKKRTWFHHLWVGGAPWVSMTDCISSCCWEKHATKRAHNNKKWHWGAKSTYVFMTMAHDADGSGKYIKLALTLAASLKHVALGSAARCCVCLCCCWGVSVGRGHLAEFIN